MKLHCLLAIIVVFLFVSGIFYPLHQDEQVFMQVAQVVKNGGVPYLNILDNKPPGIYLVWFMASQFTFPIVITRIITIFANLISGWFIFLVGKELLGKTTALLSSFSYLILLYPYQGQFAITEPFMTMWLLSGIYFLIQQSKSSSPCPKSILLSGFLFGLALVFKQVAIINIFAVTIWILTTTELGENFRQKGINFIHLCLGISLPWIPILIYFHINNAISLLWYALVTYNLTQYPPSPLMQTIKQLSQILAPLIIWFGIIYLIHLPQIINTNRFRNEINIFWFFTLMPLPVILTRPYHHYWLQILPFFIILSFHYYRRIFKPFP